MIDSRSIIPNTATHPGEVVGDEIEARGWSVEQMAEKMGVAPEALTLLLEEKANVTPDLAAKLEKAFDIPAVFWLNLQKKYESTVAYLASRKKRRKKK